MKKYLLLFLGTILSFNVLNASPINLDIYGVDSTIQNKIIACCIESIREDVELQQQLNSAQQGDLNKILKRKSEVEKSILKKINKFGKFSLTKISMVYYPDDKTNYTTIDIVNVSDSYRLPISTRRQIKKHIAKTGGLNNLFKLWVNYNAQNLELIRGNHFDFKDKSCPVAHCAWGFDKKELDYYLPAFKSGALKYKNQLMDIIEHSANDTEREQAIFILGHINNYQELTHFLMKFTNDPSDVVRNNTMRVLGAILSKHDVNGLDINRILKALDYPYVTDRNKAAYVLLNIVLKDKSSHQLVVKKSGATLIKLLKLKQPNNHDFAYRILKVISNQNYSDHDYKNWQEWLDSEKHKLNIN